MRTVVAILNAVIIWQVAVNPTLESFQKEAENALGKKIEITESADTGAANGQTYCDATPVRIIIKRGLESSLRKQVLAHEIGHALLCSRGIVVYSASTTTARIENVEALANALGSNIGSCFIDPLANSEAKKRGLRTEKTTQARLDKLQSHTKEEIHRAVNSGQLGLAFAVSALYCTEILPHSFPNSQLEKPFGSEPPVIAELRALERNLRAPVCRDDVSCFDLAIRLRDALAVKNFVLLKNPRTGRFE